MELRSRDISAAFWDCLVTGQTFNSDSRGHSGSHIHLYKTFQTQNHVDLGSFLAFSAAVNRWMLEIRMKVDRMIWFLAPQEWQTLQDSTFSCMLFLRCKAHRCCKSLLDLDKYWHRQPSLRLEWELHSPNGCTAAATKTAWFWSSMAGPWAVRLILAFPNIADLYPVKFDFNLWICLGSPCFPCEHCLRDFHTCQAADPTQSLTRESGP